MRKVKPLNDFIFKKIFGEKGNEDILISFINAVLKRTNKEPIVEIEIVDNKQLTKNRYLSVIISSLGGYEKRLYAN